MFHSQHFFASFSYSVDDDGGDDDKDDDEKALGSKEIEIIQTMWWQQHNLKDTNKFEENNRRSIFYRLFITKIIDEW